jgi:hypothetical protein
MLKLRSGLTYANVIATLALFSSKVKDGSLLAGDFKG